MPRYSRIFSFSAKYTFLCVALTALIICIGSVMNHKKGKPIFWMLILGIMSAIRVNTGSDYFNYYSMYNSVSNYYSTFRDILSERYQNGFMILSYLINKYIGGTYSIFIVIAITTSIILGYFFFKYSDMPNYTVIAWMLLGFYLISMNILKQYIAMVIMMAAYFAYKKKRKITFFLLTLLATSFHATAIIFAISVPLMKYIHVTRGAVIRSLSIGVVVSTLSIPITKLLTKIPIFNHYIMYIDMENLSSYRLAINSVIMIGFFIYVIYIFLKEKNVDGGNNFDFAKFIIIGIFISTVSINFVYAARIAYYYFQFAPFLISSLMSNNSSSKAVKYSKRLIFSMIAYCFLFTAFSGENNYYNYSTIFNDYPVSIQQFIGR